MTLRPYQTRAVAQVRDAVLGGSRAVALVMPTGSGKTRTAAAIAHQSVSRGRRVLWLAHRVVLLGPGAEISQHCAGLVFCLRPTHDRLRTISCSCACRGMAHSEGCGEYRRALRRELQEYANALGKSVEIVVCDHDGNYWVTDQIVPE